MIFPDNTVFKTLKNSETDEDGDVSIILPRPRPKGFISRLFYKGDKKVLLDDLGTFVWNYCDSLTTFREIVDNVQKEYPHEEDIERRVFLFLNHLAVNNFVRILLPADDSEDSKL